MNEYTQADLDRMQRDADRARLVTLTISQHDLCSIIHALAQRANPADAYLLRCLREKVRR